MSSPAFLALGAANIGLLPLAFLNGVSPLAAMGVTVTPSVAQPTYGPLTGRPAWDREPNPAVTEADKARAFERALISAAAERKAGKS